MNILQCFWFYVQVATRLCTVVSLRRVQVGARSQSPSPLVWRHHMRHIPWSRTRLGDRSSRQPGHFQVSTAVRQVISCELCESPKVKISVSQGASQGRSFLSRASDLACPGVAPPLWQTVPCGWKTTCRMAWLPGGVKSLICLAVSTHYRRVTDRWTSMTA